MTKRSPVHAGKVPGGQPIEQRLASDRRATTTLPATKQGPIERISSTRFAAAERELQALFGRNLRDARNRLGLTQTDVANIVDSNQSFIGAVERGAQNVRLSTVVRLAFAVRTDPGALLLGENAKDYGLETLARIVAALHAYLQNTLDQSGPTRFSGDMLTIIPRDIHSRDPGVLARPKSKPSAKR
jgi:transcriptional regulator with XRE-family HTH domain